jgi:hypothetical protein
LAVIRLHASAIAALLALSSVIACGGEAGDPIESGEDDQTTWVAPAEGSCEAKGLKKVANEATVDELDGDAKLDRRAAENIVAARPFSTVKAIDDVSRVGGATMSALFAYAREKGHLASCGSSSSSEIGIVSDLDKTVIPEATPDLSKAPYPGVKALLDLLEHRNGGADGDIHYVTARSPEKVVDVPDYLAQHGVPSGSIDTGVSTLPWVAQAEKIRDIEAILARTGTQKFVLLGDSSHKDPEVYKAILAAHPDRIIGGFIHKVNATVTPSRVTGLVLHNGYPEVAAKLYGLEVITRAEALSVMKAAKQEGFAITTAEMEALLDANEP